MPLVILSIMPLVFDGCAPSTVDRHGNPIFHAKGILDTTFGEQEVDVNYYTIFPNVFDPHSSVYISDKPTPAEVVKFALEKPVYNFILHKNHVVSRLVMLVNKGGNGKNAWTWFVTDAEERNFEVAAGVKGDMAEQRYVELMGDKAKTDPGGLKHQVLVAFDKRIYVVIPFREILADFEKTLAANKFD
jgi:hypothetical protein